MGKVWLAVAQFSYFLMFLGLCSPNLELLQGFFLSGSLLAVVYAWRSGNDPLWVPLSWHLAFLALSGTFVIRTGIKKRKDQLDPVERFLKNTVFHTFSVQDLRSFIRFGMEGGDYGIV